MLCYWHNSIGSQVQNNSQYHLYSNRVRTKQTDHYVKKNSIKLYKIPMNTYLVVTNVTKMKLPGVLKLDTVFLGCLMDRLKFGLVQRLIITPYMINLKLLSHIFLCQIMCKRNLHTWIYILKFWSGTCFIWILCINLSLVEKILSVKLHHKKLDTLNKIRKIWHSNDLSVFVKQVHGQ